MKVYLDNAATTPLDPRVMDAMLPFFTDYYGNPSSIHARGREVRAAIEKARNLLGRIRQMQHARFFFGSQVF